MEVYFLRHGEAGKRMAATAKDGERTLTAAGRAEIEKVAEALAELDFKFDVVVTSPVKRAKETAQIVNKALGRKAQVEEWVELSPEGSRDAFYRAIAKLRPDSSVLCVGHEPYLTSAIADMIRTGSENDEALRILLKKGGMARLTVAGFGPRPNGQLRWLLTPRQIRRMA